MHDVNEENIASAVTVLEEVRLKRVCSYGSRSFCDCKFGGREITDLRKADIDAPNYVPRDESCGCPELRFVVGLMQRLTVEEIKELKDREPVR